MSTPKDSKSLSQERYSQFAQGYVTSQSHAKGSELDRLIEIAQPQADWMMLDVATGGGHTALKFAPHVKQVIASDLTPNMLEKAQAFVVGEKGASNVEFKQADAENLPFEDDTFDLVTCRIAPHHFPDCAKFVREATRVLKTSGILLVQDHVLPDDEESARYVDEFETVRDPSHHRAYNQSEWVAMFEAAGLTVQHTEQLNKRHDFLDWAGRQETAPEILEQLIEMMTNAPTIAAGWMDAKDWGTDQATFVNHHLIIRGQKL